MNENLYVKFRISEAESELNFSAEPVIIEIQNYRSKEKNELNELLSYITNGQIDEEFSTAWAICYHLEKKYPNADITVFNENNEQIASHISVKNYLRDKEKYPQYHARYKSPKEDEEIRQKIIG